MADPIKEQHDFWFTLFKRAFEKSPFDALCTLLRPRGMHDAGWDVLDESHSAFEDFNWMLTEARKQKTETCARRLALHYYCFVIEMNAVHEMIANLLRCLSGKHYLPSPLAHLNRGKKNGGPWNIVPASMPTKIREISKLATELGETELIERIAYVFDEPLRNSIAHSDFVLLPNELRILGGGPQRGIKLTEIDHLIAFTFAFISGLLTAQASMKYLLKGVKRFHQWPNYEVLELLSGDEGVLGFHVHFSNGSRSTFRRDHGSVTQVNMVLRDGVGFMVGAIDNLEPVWKVNGVPVVDWEAINRT